MKKSVLSMALILAISNVYADKSINYTYNTNGNIASIDGPRTDIADITNYIYDTNDQLQSITNPLGHTITYSNYDSYGNPQIITDENGIASTLAYTTDGWLASITTSGSTTSFNYDAIGQITKVTFPDNSALSYAWDGAKRLASIKNNLNDSINYSYDAMGNRTEETIKNGTTITQQLKRQFDELGRVKALIDANNQSYTYDYGTYDKPILEKDPKGLEITNTYDGLNRLYMTRENANSNWAQLQYDLNDNITYAKDKLGVGTGFTYNNTDDLLRENGRARGIIDYQYDEAGNLVQETNARGNITQYSYDALNRLISQVYPNKPELNIEYSYDQPATGFYNIGYLTTINDASGTTEYNYNILGLVAQEKRQLKLEGELLGDQQVINYTYDKAGRVLTTDYGLATLNYTRNAGGQVTVITLVQDGRTLTLADTITYRPFGKGITGLKWKNGLTLNRSYNLDGQLTQQTIDTSTTDYQYDNNGNIAQIADSQFGTTNYEYNEFNQLTKEQGTTTTTYSYDAVANRLTKVNDNEQQQISYYQGSILNTNGIYYKKDAVNNITGYQDSTKTYEYDESNRFSKVIKTENNVQTTLARYIHNAYSERTIKVKEDGSISTFMYNDIGQLIGETQYNVAKEKVKEIYWVWLDTLPVAQIGIPYTNGIAGTQVISYIHSDHLDTPRWATNQSKQMVWSWQSDAYGTTLANEDPSNIGINTTIPLRFAGQYFDTETGFHYNYFRTYIPDLGRYSQSDPIGLDGGWNTFSYVGGNPLKNVDLKGLQTTIQCYGFGCIITYRPPNNPSEEASHILGGAILGELPIYSSSSSDDSSDATDECDDIEERRCKAVQRGCYTECTRRYTNGGFGKGSDVPAQYRNCMRDCMVLSGCYSY